MVSGDDYLPSAEGQFDQFEPSHPSRSDPSMVHRSANDDDPDSTSTMTSVPMEPAATETNVAPLPQIAEMQRSGVFIEQQVQQNYGTIAGTVEIVNNVRQMLDYHDLPNRYVKECVNAFALPPRIDKAREVLRRNHIVVLVADVDSGRHDAAVYLLGTQESVTLREVRRESGDRLDIAELETETRSGWLLDLRGDQNLDHSLGRSLLGHRERLRSCGSYLVAIIPRALWTQVGIGGDELAFFLEPAAAAEIVRSRLKALKPPINAEPYLQAAEIQQRLHNATPADGVRWVEAIRKVTSTPFQLEDERTYDQLNSDEVQTSLIKSVIQVCGNWRSELLEWHKSNFDSRLRNFLLAAAVLEGHTAGEIFEAATKVAVALGEDKPDVDGQRGAGILELIDLVDAHLPDEEHLRFMKPGYADAILDYFWIDRQHLQTEFVAWMCQLPLGLKDTEAAESISGRIGSYVLQWTRRHQKVKMLRDVVRRWAPARVLRTTLVNLLTAAALEPNIVGKFVRDDLLDWAKTEGSGSLAIRTLTAQVCGGDFAKIYPKVALNRLAWLAQSADLAVVEAVQEAMKILWRQPNVRDQIIDQVSTWCTSTDVGRKQAGLRAFLALAGLQDSNHGFPELSLQIDSTSKARRKLLEQGWRTVLSAQPVESPSASEVLAIWLDAALLSSELQTLLKEVLAIAVGGADALDVDYRRFVRLNGLLYCWQPANKSESDGPRVDLRDGIVWHLHQSNPALIYIATDQAQHPQ